MPHLVLPQSTETARTFDLDRVRRIHVMGVGGTGMGTFAALLKQSGYEVTGSDEGIYPPMSELLASWSIECFSGYRSENLDRARPDLVVVGNVIRRVNPEATALRERGLPYLSFPQALAELFLTQRRPVVIAGTHGKTTCSALTTHVLTHAGRDPSALIGGVALNLSSPQGRGGSFRLGAGDLFVVEGDEYDTAYFDKRPKFLHYRPEVALLTSVEFDHADIYRDMAHYRSAFADFLALLPKSGFLAVAQGSPEAMALARYASCPVATYGIDAGDFTARNLSFDASGASFTALQGEHPLGTWRLPLFGRHNVENALGVAAVCRHLGLDPDEIGAGLAGFLGVRRRQELLGSPGGIAVVDDFAHHPTAVRETLAAVRAHYPGRRVLAIFEPRSNTSRRNIHRAEYARAFAGADLALLAAPHLASQIAEGERLIPEQLAREIAAQGTPARFVSTVEGLVAEAAAWAHPGDVILVMSNGSFGGLPYKLLQTLEA
jgi:UDP-N-acetylmuramate: L-alanyl-gamma-D-glutamyl-meso-diaminopimelate ligase